MSMPHDYDYIAHLRDSVPFWLKLPFLTRCWAMR